VNDLPQHIFPRELTKLEKELLFSVLPEKKPGYNKYRKIINGLVVAGRGMFGGNNLVMCPAGTTPDDTIPSAPVFALGTVIYSSNKADIVIHEEMDKQLEFDISFDNENFSGLKEIKRWGYSDWRPGHKAPGDGSHVREIIIDKNKYVLAIAQVHKKIWLYDYESGVNYIIPVTNFYSYLMLVKNIRQPDIVLKPALFFQNSDSYSDEELKTAFFAYNKYFKRLKLKS
jgi:hypothetical protein